MHCCANATHQWESFKKIEGLRVLNLVQPSDVLERAAEFFGNSLCHYHYGPGHDYIPAWAYRLPGDAHCVIDIGVNSKDEALRALEAVHRFDADRQR